MSGGRRRRAAAAVGLALALGLGLGWGGHTVRERLRVRTQRKAMEETRASWRRALDAHGRADALRTYAAVFAGPVGTAWAELLTAAGVPPPATLPSSPPATPLDPGFRLVVVHSMEVAEAEALAEAGRAVIHVDAGAEPAPVDTATVAGVTVPLAGEPVRRLELAAGESPVVLAADGAILGAARPVGQGVVVRLGVDLAALFYRLRQGEPRWAGQDRDHNGALQPADLLPAGPPHLYGAPFADLAMDALLLAVARSWPACPLPRTRGLPEGVTRLVVVTSDQDYASDEIVERLAHALAGRAAGATFLLTDPDVGLPADLNVGPDGRAPRLGRSAASTLLAAGFGLGIHPFPRHADDVRQVAQRFYSLVGHRPLVARNHHLRWHGYVDVALAEEASGVALNLDYMAVCPGSAPCAAFIGGSVQPVRFRDAGGKALRVLQQPTAVDDFSLRLENPQARAAAAHALGDSAVRMLRAAEAAGGPLVVNVHPALYALAPEWLTPLFSAAAAGTRFVSAEAWLGFVARRRLAAITLARCGQPRAELLPGVTLRPAP